MPQPARAEPQRDERDSVRASDGLPVELAERDGYLLELVGAPTLCRMGRSWRVREDLGESPGGLRRVCRGRLELLVDGWCDEQSAARGGKKPDPTPRTGPSRAPSGAC